MIENSQRNVAWMENGAHFDIVEKNVDGKRCSNALIEIIEKEGKMYS